MNKTDDLVGIRIGYETNSPLTINPLYKLKQRENFQTSYKKLDLCLTVHRGNMALRVRYEGRCLIGFFEETNQVTSFIPYT